MAASINDTLLRVASNTGWQLDASGISDASVTSFGLVSATGLPTTSAIVITVDRVNSSGVATPTKMERIKGIVSGSSLISCVRGFEGTAQAHAAGAVVEIVISAGVWNALIDGVMTDRDQLGRRVLDTDTYAPSGAGTTTLDLSSGNLQKVTMPAATQTLAITNSVVGQIFIVEIVNVTSQGALTWFSTISWADGTAPTLTNVNGKRDKFAFQVVSAGVYDGSVIGQNY